MKSLASLFLIAAPALAACATQGPAREPATPQRLDVCGDRAFAPVCTPTPHQAPVQVDTNLKAASRTANLG